LPFATTQKLCGGEGTEAEEFCDFQFAICDWSSFRADCIRDVGGKHRDRCDNRDDLAKQLAAIEEQRNQAAKGADWQFSVGKARIKLRRLYPSFEMREGTRAMATRMETVR
jgi:hypothetical protein